MASPLEASSDRLIKIERCLLCGIEEALVSNPWAKYDLLTSVNTVYWNRNALTYVWTMPAFVLPWQS